MKGSLITFIAITLFTCIATRALGEQRKFVSDAGVEITAEIQMVNGDDVMLKRSDNQTFSVPISRFSADDQAYIKKWAKDNEGKVPAHLKDKIPKLTMAVNTGKRTKKDDNQGGYVHERKQKFQFSVVMKNEDRYYPVPKAKVTLLVIGESTTSGKRTVIYREVFDDIALPLYEEVTVTGKAFELWYDDIGATYGFKHKGQFAILQDPEGKILHQIMIPSSAKKYTDNVLNLQAGDIIGKDFTKNGSYSLSNSVKF